MKDEATAAGLYAHCSMGRMHPRIQIVTVREIVEEHKRLEMPLSIEVVKSALPNSGTEQLDFTM